MRVNVGMTNAFAPRNSFFNAGQVNASLNYGKTQSVRGAERSGKENRDKAAFSKESRFMSAIDALNKQKKEIIKKKGELVSRALGDGKGTGSIKTQMEVYTKQMDDIDKQIQTLNAQQAQEVIDKLKPKAKDREESDEGKTQDEITIDNMSKLAEASNLIDISEKLSSVQERARGAEKNAEAEEQLGKVELDKKKVDAVLTGTNINDAVRETTKAIIKDKAEAEIQGELADKISLMAGKKLNAAEAESKEVKNRENDKVSGGEAEQTDSVGEYVSEAAEETSENVNL